MFNFLKKMRNKDNTPKKGYDLSYDNLAIPENQIDKVHVEQTYISGQLKYERKSAL